MTAFAFVAGAFCLVSQASSSSLPGSQIAQSNPPESVKSEVAPQETNKSAPKNAPVRLGPRRSVLEGPNSSGTTPNSKPATDYKPASPSDGSDGAVTIQTLSDLDPDSVGVIDDTSGGLGTEMWQGTSRSFVARAIASLPSRVRSPTMRKLMRRLLLTQAVAPKGENTEPGLFQRRVKALFASGDIKSAMSLVSSAPTRAHAEHLVHFGIDGQLFQNNTAGACQRVRAYSDEFKGIYWQQVSAFCLAMTGKKAEAALLSDVLAERSDAIHPAFFAGMERLSGATPPQIVSLTGPSALHLALMRSAGLALPEDTTEKASPAALRAIALSPNATLDLRLTAAEEAVDIGVLDGKILADIYSAVAFDAAVLKQAPRHAADNWGVGGRALLVQAAQKAGSAAERAKLIQLAFQLARQKGGWRATAFAHSPMVKALSPSTETTWFAGDAARILITVGDIAGARKWLAYAHEQKLRSNEKSALWPLQIFLSGAEISSIEPKEITNWWNVRTAAGTAPIVQARTLFSLLSAMGTAVPSELWGKLLDGGPATQAYVPSAVVRNALSRAAQTGSRGGTVAMALVALGDRGAGVKNLSAVEMAISALKKIEFAAEAKAIALEAAIEAGL
ncbi:MAG: hypothetical protein GKS01_01360 [Alphaproteobacteria bacterium]|nr:hypothetical protein [Alphaproteobacteria bacterium]